MALTQLLGGPQFDTVTNADSALYADFHYFFNSGSVIRSNPWNSPIAPVAKTMTVTNITANNVALNYVNTSGSIVAITLSGSESRIITSQTLPLGLDNNGVGLFDNDWLSVSNVTNHIGSVVARPTGSRFFEMAGIRTIAQSTNMYTIADGATTITKTSLSSPVSGSSFRYVCSRTIPYLDQPFWLIRDIANCSGGTTTTTTTTTTSTTTTTLAPTTTTTTISPNFIQYLVVAGGGGGGFSNNTSARAGGGGAGGWMTGSATIAYSSTPITVTVGNGGLGGQSSPFINSTNGGDSVFNDLVVDGGGRGGLNGTTAQTNGGNGGSGGGASTLATAGTGIAGEGFNGSRGTGAPTTRGGSGGGAVEAATNTQAGSGKLWLDGNYYAAGGAGDNAAGANNGAGTRGSGGDGLLGNNGQNGQGGIVIIRYQGIPRATGGTITNVGGFTYHTFTSSGNFTFNGVTSTTTSTTTTAGPTTTLASQKYYVESCDGPGSIVGVITITNAPTLNAGDVIRLNTNVAGLSCFTVFSTSTGTPTLGTRSVTNIWPGADCGNCTD